MPNEKGLPLPANAPAPKTQASSGSLNNMLSPAQQKDFDTNRKPGIVAGIRKSWAQIAKRHKELNGAIRFTDRG